MPSLEMSFDTFMNTSPRSPAGTVSTFLTVDAKRTHRANGPRMWVTALCAHMVIPSQDQIGRQMWPLKTFSPTVNNIS